MVKLNLRKKNKLLGTTLIEIIVSTVIITLSFLLFSVIWAKVLNGDSSATSIKLLYVKIPPGREWLLKNCNDCKMAKEYKDNHILFKVIKNGKPVLTWVNVEKSNVIDSLFNH